MVVLLDHDILRHLEFLLQRQISKLPPLVFFCAAYVLWVASEEFLMVLPLLAVDIAFKLLLEHVCIVFICIFIILEAFLDLLRSFDKILTN